MKDVNLESQVYHLSVFMPAAGAQAVTDVWCSKPDWVVRPYLDGDYSYWGIGTRNGYLLPGESVVLKLTTNADVPTANNYVPSGWLSNYMWFDTEAGSVFGNSIVPVPVPEPSSLLALAGGIGGLALRRTMSR